MFFAKEAIIGRLNKQTPRRKVKRGYRGFGVGVVKNYGEREYYLMVFSKFGIRNSFVYIPQVSDSYVRHSVTF
jgi:hypothetical protein